ncbi:MAG: carbamoyltransferase HypF [Candidatus Palauibacterales bacterium]|nr:carbamoyltransferase HypF [Candidatus Palauibacterales bacterium]
MAAEERPADPHPRDGAEKRRRVRARITGVVQGVGFRPFVYRLASSLDLAGYVLNDSRGVLLEVEGDARDVARFFGRFRSGAPPLSTVEEVGREELEPHGEVGFEIVESEDSEPPSALVSPDTATCADCLEELFDPADRRYRYPFINCTNCGPRFTIIQGVPYDRPQTTMSTFEMCGPCRAEYEDPADRRFHAQPNACPDCGPSARLVDPTGVERAGASSDDPDRSVRAAAEALMAGEVVAVKGLGGYHLACRADDAAAVSRLRDRKHREDKPFALMPPDPDAARELVRLDEEEARLLKGRERPIVLARRRPDAPVAPAVASGHRDLGVMLPYSPLHHLLLDETGGALVMTSGNVSDEPIAYRDREALERLEGIADLFLVHDRPIHMRTDDSVVRVVSAPGGRRPVSLRRSRGYVPMPVPTPVEAPPLLACGAHLKNTFSVARGERVWVGHHIGDLENLETLLSFREGVEHFEDLFSVEPELVAHDFHPDYLSTRYALEERDLPALGVQHHHAHHAACLAEHGEEGPAVGVIFDGTGYGTDGTVWGGEILVGDLAGFDRAGSLWPVRLPGGEAAIREPWRTACSWLCELTDGVPPIPETLQGDVDREDWELVTRLARRGVSSPVTTSVGRLFDAVSALCGVRSRVNYEGQAAIELEMAAAAGVGDGAYDLPLLGPGEAPGAGASDREGPPERRILDGRAAVRAVVDDLSEGVSASEVGARFHRGLAAAAARAASDAAGRAGTETVVLSGGVFQNVLLLERTAALLDEAGLRVLVPERLPANDGGISYGQAAVAAARLRSGA